MTGREKLNSLPEEQQNEIFAMMMDEISDTSVKDLTHMLLDMEYWSAEEIDEMLESEDA